MIYLDLFLGFLKVGLLSFGAYGAIPLIREIVLSYGWLNDESFSYIIAVSESTPGPLMLNIATYVGNVQGGLPGAVIATFSVILPSFIIILIVTASMKLLIRNPFVHALLQGLKPCIIGIILATGCYMLINECLIVSNTLVMNRRSLLLSFLLLCVLYGYRFLSHRKLSPIVFILVGAILGIII